MKITQGGGEAPGAAPLREAQLDEEQWLRCAACGARLTPERARIEVDGAHEHEFMNPSGMRFRVACFTIAPGCMPDGERSAVWTWFPGRPWQIQICKSCGAHVGWSFHGEASDFYALVRDRLA